MKEKQTCIYDTHLNNKYNACGHGVWSGNQVAPLPWSLPVWSCASPLWPLQALLVCSFFTLHTEKIFEHTDQTHSSNANMSITTCTPGPDIQSHNSSGHLILWTANSRLTIQTGFYWLLMQTHLCSTGAPGHSGWLHEPGQSVGLCQSPPFVCSDVQRGFANISTFIWVMPN